MAELQRVSAQTRSSRLDRAYLHRRRVRGQGGKGSRAWYVDEAAWLAGTTADATAAPKFFQEEVGVHRAGIGSFYTWSRCSKPLIICTSILLLCLASWTVTPLGH